MSRARELFDSLYIGIEGWINGQKDRRSGMQYARTVEADPRVDREYATTIRSYWKQFRVRTPQKFWFTLLSNKHKPFSPKYIPDDIWFARIAPHFSDPILARAWQDKCIHNVLFPDVRHPETVVKNIAGVFYDDDLKLLTEEEAVLRCHGMGRVIVKPSVGSGAGKGIRFYDTDAITDDDIRDVFRLYKRNFIIQKKLVQHPDLARLNPGSLNTLRIITFLHKDQVRVLSSVLRIGGSTSEVDNISQGGFQCNVLPDGRLQSPAMTHFRGRWEYLDAHPAGIPFAETVVPSFRKVLDTVTRYAARMAHFKIIGWDISVDPDGEPVLIEFNALPGQNQETDGPTFGDLTDEVLEEVFGRR